MQDSAICPYLSVVAASRNDDHGGDPLIRTQIFISSFARQCEKYQLPAELILIDWNPVPERPGLAEVLYVPAEVACVRARVITVPTSLHQRFKYGDRLPLLQMIAKNVGIRRAKGEFILATNIDILFSDQLMQFLALQRLDPEKQYRVDRYDIRSGLSRDALLDDVVNYAWSNVIRAHYRYQPETLVKHLYADELFKQVCIPDGEFQGEYENVNVLKEDNVWQIRPNRSVSMSCLHTNACGDFTLLSREGWRAIRGYPEMTGYSFNIDSMGLIAGHYAGFCEVSLLPPCVCFHIEHGLGSGWTPGTGEKALFSRLRNAGIIIPDWPVLMPLVEKMRTEAKPLEFNYAAWGMADFDLPEQVMGASDPIPTDKFEQLASQAEGGLVCSLQPAFDLDRLILAHERQGPGSTVVPNTHQATLYMPDSTGNYSELHTIAYTVNLSTMTFLVFYLEKFPHQFPLRLDPCQSPGLIRFNFIKACELTTQKMIWEINARNHNKIAINGTAVWPDAALIPMATRKGMFSKATNDLGRPFQVISTGSDPQLMLPRLPQDSGFPVAISMELTFLPSG